MPGERQRRRIAGSVLIIVGLILFLLQFVGAMHVGLVLTLVGASLLVGYFYRPGYAFLIPGCILVGLGLGRTAERLGVAGGEPTLVGLGAGFVVIYLVALAHMRMSNPWPLIPGAILILVGVVPESDTLQWLLEVGWPLIIVLVGAFILLGSLWGARDGPEPADAGAGEQESPTAAARPPREDAGARHDAGRPDPGRKRGGAAARGAGPADVAPERPGAADAGGSGRASEPHDEEDPRSSSS